MSVWRVAAILASAFLAACAPTLPALPHGAATPTGKVDLSLGGSARLAVAGLEGDPTAPVREQPLETVQGVVPLAIVRTGLARQWDGALSVMGTGARLAIHHERVVDEGMTRQALLFGLAPHGSWARTSSRASAHLGLEALAAYAVDFGRLYELWVGPALGADHHWAVRRDGRPPTQTSAWTLRAGLLAGFALGLGPLHAFAELRASYEHWLLRRDQQPDTQRGLVLNPTFGLRLRL